MLGKDDLRILLETPGVSGYEDEIADKISEYFKPYSDDIKRDVLGNMIAKISGQEESSEPRPKIMLAAHMDEIGLMVTKVDEKGFLHVTQIGGIDQRTLPTQEVVVHGREKIKGVIGAKPPHLSSPDERKKSVPMSELLVDIGYDQAKAKELVSVGDLITIDRKMMELKGGRLAGKAMDNRAGVMVILEALKELKKLKFKADVFAVATVQEEVGLRGAVTSTYGLVPEIGIAIDVCHAIMPGVPDASPLGGGPAVGLGPNIHPKVHQLLKKTAGEERIPMSIEALPGGSGTDAWAMQISRGGVATGVISIPLRYMHTAVETLAYSDIEQSGKLLAHFIARVDSAFVEGLSCY